MKNYPKYLIVCLLFLSLFFNCKGKKAEEPLAWAQGIVWYQLFPERFCNGDPANDPVASEVPELFPGDPWEISPWTSDWYEVQPWEKARNEDDFYELNMVFARRYGGDLEGVIQKLDYLQKLGIDAIYFNPLFEAESLHKYDGSTYHHIDDNFGPDPTGDKQRLAEAHETEDPATWIWTEADKLFLKLLDEAHKRNIRVVLDGVFNHTGVACFVFQDIIRNQQNSRYADWYLIDQWDDPNTEENEFDYKGWWGYKTLPEFKEDSLGLVRGPRQYVFNATRRWLDPNQDGDTSDGIDGWRLDVANEIATAFWVEWYHLVKSINPSAITVSELWDDASDWIHGDQKRMDNTMNYLLSRAIVDFFVDVKTGYSGVEFANRLETILDLYGTETSHVLWNLIGSHDTERLASTTVNPERDFDRQSGPRDNPDYLVRKPNEIERKIQKQIVTFQMTYIGAPMIYYGDEAGMWGADDPDDRKPMVWPEFEYAVEKCHPLPGHTRPADTVEFDHALFDFYAGMIQLRHQHAALQTGDVRILPQYCSDHVLVYSRENADEQIVVCFNRDAADREVTLPESEFLFTKYNDFEGRSCPIENGEMHFTLDPKDYVIVISQK